MASPKLFLVFWLLFINNASSSSIARHHVTFPCPQDCHCLTNYSNFLITYYCSSLDFINKLSPTEHAQITSLDLTNASLHILDKRLKKLVNLERLNLSKNKLTNLKYFPHLSKLIYLNLGANNIKSFSVKNFPTTLKSLDLSHNYIKQLPHDIVCLRSLKYLTLYTNHFSCNHESLEIRDQLVENQIKFIGHADCSEPEKFKGQSWFTAVDLDEFFKIQDEEGIQADEPDGSGEKEGSGGYELVSEIITEHPINKNVKLLNGMVSEFQSEQVTIAVETETTTLSDFEFSGDSEINEKESDPILATITSVSPGEIKETDEKLGNVGTNIFLGIFFICFIALLIYAVKKYKQKLRIARRRRREEKMYAEPIEMMPNSADKQNGNSESVPLMNGQNGSSKLTEPNDLDRFKEADIVQPLLDKDPVTENKDHYLESSALCLADNVDVKAVKTKVSEIPDSVPQTPILVSRSKTSDGNLVLIPKTTKKNS